MALSYILIIIAVLVLLNTYPLVVSQNMVFRSKQTTMQSSVSVMVSALSGLDVLTEKNVAQAMTVAEEAAVSRVLVTDADGMVLYDDRETGGAVGRYALYTEITEALGGYDAFHSRYEDGAFRSRAASPVVYRGQIIGAVYAYEYDTEQAELLGGLQQNLCNISLVTGLAVLLISLVLSKLLTARFGELLSAIRIVRRGDYNHRTAVGGHDEIAALAREFDSLTDRLQVTENARRRFVADASHELKTPLASIRLLSDSILQTEEIDEATVREFVGDIRSESERLQRITEELLHLTKLDGEPPRPGSAVTAEPVVERVVHMLRLLAEERGVVLNVHLQDACTVRGAEDDLYQMVYNLTENAIKYNQPGGFVEITLRRTGETAQIEVADDGIGIPEEDLPKVFERFYRVDKARSRAAGGPGLGLSIVHDTAARWGGSVTARARPGGGTVFVLTLPLWREEDAP